MSSSSNLGSTVGPKIYVTYDDKDKGMSCDGAFGIRADTVSQATSSTTAVTLNSPGGVITTFAGTLAAQGVESFVFTNSELAGTAASPRTLWVTLQHYTGGGDPLICVTTRDETAATATISVFNTHASAALDANLKIRFYVSKEAFAAPL